MPALCVVCNVKQQCSQILSALALQVWYDTTLTMHDKPATCTAFMATLAPTDGPATSRKAGTNTVILPTTVLPANVAGCNVKLPVLCM